MLKVSNLSPRVTKIAVWLAILVSPLQVVCASRQDRFDPLKFDNEWDSYSALREFRFTTPSGVDFREEPPKEEQARIAFFVRNIANTDSFHTPLGFRQNFLSILLLRTGERVLPQVRAAFRKAVSGPRRGEEAELLACVLGRFHDSSMFEPLALAAFDEPSLAISAVWSLPRVDPKRSIPVLIELLHRIPDEDWANFPLAVGDALKVATGHSFPKPVYHPGKTKPVAVWQDVEKWKKWAEAYQADKKPVLPPKVVATLKEHRAKRRATY
jgi:hypothetical protein